MVAQWFKVTTTKDTNTLSMFSGYVQPVTPVKPRNHMAKSKVNRG